MTPRLDFASDNVAPIAPEAMAALVAANQGLAAAYGADETTMRAADLVRSLLDADAEVRFLASGTAANSIALAMLGRPFEAVLAHEDAHILTDETGAPGFFGQGVGLTGLPGAAGKIDPHRLVQALDWTEQAHRQPPAALSLTNATEAGGVYSTTALAHLCALARARALRVHLDGARLANAAAAGFDLRALGRMGVDVLVLGGAKAGMPPGEALVVLDATLARRIDMRLKQAGQLVSKGRFLAAAFAGMIETGAWIRHAAHANAMARRLGDLMPFPLRHPVEANGVFVEMDEPALGRLKARGWQVYRMTDGSVRFMCSWATRAEDVEALGADLADIA